MTLAYRPNSPILNNYNSRNRVPILITEDNKIHRIQLNSPALCQFAHLDSPNSIWFRLVNHIGEELQIAPKGENSAPLNPLDANDDELKQYDYVMAPLEEGIYARARVLSIHQVHGQLFVFAHFIDQGFGAWMFSECLAKMERKLYCYPWQAFPVSLFKLELEVDLSIGMEFSEEWPQAVHAELLRILNQFELFKVVPVFDRLQNNYSEYTRAEIYGLNSADDNEDTAGEGESIGHHLAMECGSLEVFERRMFAAKQQALKRPVELAELDATDIGEILQSMPNWRQKFPEDLSNKVDDINNNLEAVDLAKKKKKEERVDQPVRKVSFQKEP